MSFDRRTLLQLFAATAATGLATQAASATGAEVHVIADLAAKPEAADAFRQFLVDFVANARKENGCKHYVLLEDPAQAGQFYTFEIWADKAALDAHLNSPAMQAAGPKLKDILAKPPKITPLKMLSDS
jgi:quinol monooxygenase YgiN